MESSGRCIATKYPTGSFLAFIENLDSEPFCDKAQGVLLFSWIVNPSHRYATACVTPMFVSFVVYAVLGVDRLVYQKLVHLTFSCFHMRFPTRRGFGVQEDGLPSQVCVSVWQRLNNVVAASVWRTVLPSALIEF